MAFKSKAGVKYREGDEITSYQFAGMGAHDQAKFSQKPEKRSGRCPEMPVGGSNAQNSMIPDPGMSDEDLNFMKDGDDTGECMD